MQLLGRRFDTGKTSLLEIHAGRIARIAPLEVDAATAAGWPWIAPGLWDLQVNGYAGQAFSSRELTPRQVADIGRKMFAFGVTRFLPTLTTERQEVLVHGLRTIDEACRIDPLLDRQIAGIHLEGPYISREDGPRGAHPASCCRAPDWDEFQRLQEAAQGRIRLLTMGVEFDSAAEFVGRVVAGGVLVAIGHTAADSRQIRRAVDAGARLSTHLGNGSHRYLPRHPNYLWDQLAEDRLWASLIVDGHHLPPEVVKTFLRAKLPHDVSWSATWPAKQASRRVATPAGSPTWKSSTTAGWSLPGSDNSWPAPRSRFRPPWPESWTSPGWTWPLQ